MITRIKEHPIDAIIAQPRPTRHAFDDERLVADAGLLLPATVVQHLDLNGLVDAHLDVGRSYHPLLAGIASVPAGAVGRARCASVHPVELG